MGFITKLGFIIFGELYAVLIMIFPSITSGTTMDRYIYVILIILPIILLPLLIIKSSLLKYSSNIRLFFISYSFFTILNNKGIYNVVFKSTVDGGDLASLMISVFIASVFTLCERFIAYLKEEPFEFGKFISDIKELLINNTPKKNIDNSDENEEEQYLE